MNTSTKWETLQPRFLHYRGHYKIYLSFAILLQICTLAFWCFRIATHSWGEVWATQSFELLFCSSYLTGLCVFYVMWIKPRMQKSVQVFGTHLLIHNGKTADEVKFSDIESVTMVYWSLFYLKMKDGHKHYFSASIERVDYIWEALKNIRPDLLSVTEFEDFRLKLVQYDHHQKRKEWFFKHKIVDVFNWCVLPIGFMFVSYLFQARDVMIYQEGLYFFRLFMYGLMVLLVTTFLFSVVLKKLVFDKKIEKQMVGKAADKLRDIEFEGMILQRSKIFQLVTACFIFSLIIRTDLNFYSVTKLKEDVSSFNLMKGKTMIIDNRFNCVKCRYTITDGDIVMFGRGFVGQVMAKEGERVGEISHDNKGRSIASTNIQEVPAGHVAVKASNGKDILFVKVVDLIGKIQN